MGSNVGIGECRAERCGTLYCGGRNLIQTNNEIGICEVHQLTSCLVSCMADSTFGKRLPNSAATASFAVTTKLLKASRTPILVLHLPASKMLSRCLNTTRVDSGGNNFKIDLTAEVAADRTTSPLSMYNSKRIGSEGSNIGTIAAPIILAKDWKAIAADSRSNPDFLLVAKECRIFNTS